MKQTTLLVPAWIAFFCFGIPLKKVSAKGASFSSAPAYLFTLPGMDDPVRSRMILIIALLVIAAVVMIVMMVLHFRNRK